MCANNHVRCQESPSCLLCGTRGVIYYRQIPDRLFGVPGHWDVLRCPQCGMLWPNPLPLPDYIPKLYTHYYTHNADTRLDSPNRFWRLIKKISICTQMGYECNELSSNSLVTRLLGRLIFMIGPLREVIENSVLYLNGTKRGKLLDIGCGQGRFLVRMRDLGWQVIGIEPDPIAAAIARERFGLEVFTTPEETCLPDNVLDAITMDHVIEHIYDPISSLRRYARLLKPGGEMILVTPNAESLGHRIFRDTWRGIEVPRHLHIFTERALVQCVREAGLHVKEVRLVAQSARYIWPLSRLIAQQSRVPIGDYSWALTAEGRVFWIVEYLANKVYPCGEEIVLIAGRGGR